MDLAGKPVLNDAVLSRLRPMLGRFTALKGISTSRRCVGTCTRAAMTVACVGTGLRSSFYRHPSGLFPGRWDAVNTAIHLPASGVCGLHISRHYLWTVDRTRDTAGMVEASLRSLVAPSDPSSTNQRQHRQPARSPTVEKGRHFAPDSSRWKQASLHHCGTRPRPRCGLDGRQESTDVERPHSLALRFRERKSARRGPDRPRTRFETEGHGSVVARGSIDPRPRHLAPPRNSVERRLRYDGTSSLKQV